MRGMTVAELIVELSDLPQGYELHVATPGGSEPFWVKGNMLVSSTNGRITITQTDEHGEAMPEGSGDLDAEDRCEHADDCMHFERMRRRPFLSQRVRNRNMAQIAATEGRQ